MRKDDYGKAMERLWEGSNRKLNFESLLACYWMYEDWDLKTLMTAIVEYLNSSDNHFGTSSIHSALRAYAYQGHSDSVELAHQLKLDYIDAILKVETDMDQRLKILPLQPSYVKKEKVLEVIGQWETERLSEISSSYDHVPVTKVISLLELAIIPKPAEAVNPLAANKAKLDQQLEELKTGKPELNA